MTDIMMNFFYMTVYVFGGLILSFISGLVIYDRTLTKGYSLKEYLFEKDSKIVWLDFFGAYILPIFIVAKNTLSGEEGNSFVKDILTVFSLMILTLIIISIARLISSIVIKKIMKKYEEKTDLNKEIFEQNNYAALFFNYSIVAFIVNILMQENIFTVENALFNFTVNALVIILITVLGLVVYKMFELKNRKYFDIMFREDKEAVGLNFFGYIFAWQIIAYKIVDFYDVSEYGNILKDGVKMKEFSLDIIGAFLIIVIFFELAKILLKTFIKKVIGEDIDSEIYDQNNLGAAFGMMIVYLGIAVIITGVMFG